MNFENISDKKANQIISMYKHDLKDRFMYKSVADALEKADEFTGLVKKLQGLDLDVVEAFQIKRVHPAFDAYGTWPEVYININGDPNESYKIFSQAFSDNLQFYISEGLAKIPKTGNFSGPKRVYLLNNKDIKSVSEFRKLFVKNYTEDVHPPYLESIIIKGTSQGSKIEDINIFHGVNVKPSKGIKDKAMNIFSKKYVDLL